MKKLLIFVTIALVFFAIGFACSTLIFVRSVVTDVVKTVVSNSSLDTYAFVEKYSPLLDRLKIPYPEGVNILEEVFIWSKFYKVNPDSVIVLIYVESGFNSTATGKYGEIGLFQLQYSTALVYYPNTLIMPEELYDVHNNVICGIAHWKSCLESAKGNCDLARRYYNGGFKYAQIASVTQYVKMHHNASATIKKMLIEG